MNLVYQTSNGQVFQSDTENCFYLNFKGETYRMNACAIIALKTKLDALNIEQILLTDAHRQPIEIIPLCNNDRILVLTVEEIIEMKDLIPGTLVMLELNSIVCQRITRAIA